MKVKGGKRNRLYIINFLIFSIITMFAFVSCGTKLVPVKYGEIATPEVTLTAEDHSFVLKSGSTWEPPFYSLPDQKLLTTYLLDLNKNTTSQYDYAIKKLGAKKVRVKTPYLEKELYGVLVFNKAMDKCKTPVTRSYQITIPEDYVQKALNGQVSVLYEYYECSGLTIKTWVLWLSDVPF